MLSYMVVSLSKLFDRYTVFYVPRETVYDKLNLEGESHRKN